MLGLALATPELVTICIKQVLLLPLVLHSVGCHTASRTNTRLHSHIREPRADCRKDGGT
jgi:hypothetical protein